MTAYRPHRFASLFSVRFDPVSWIWPSWARLHAGSTARCHRQSCTRGKVLPWHFTILYVVHHTPLRTITDASIQDGSSASGCQMKTLINVCRSPAFWNLYVYNCMHVGVVFGQILTGGSWMMYHNLLGMTTSVCFQIKRDQCLH